MINGNMSLTNVNTWIRLAYMVLFALLVMAARLLVSIVVIVQFALVLIFGRDNENLRNLGQGLGKWVYQAIMFLTFNSDDKPFPFDEWPALEPSQGYSVAASKVAGAEVDLDVSDEDIPSFTAGDRPADKDAS
ncbi:MAG: DUF4389 domain-containing protein [Cellvibrionales bacterium TMED47]|nr:hypothetical protein [Porticoccaceae bacterium]RPG85017.1 MAG: DUF4389 domain-containing protein [Cellvibrionales bacterium TMED47]|tara:strand:- start:1214 stop:1612 length:399 start_codon:yes stop_codon:yes gene_type:complete